MKITSLKLRGAIGLQKGQKVDEVVLDLSNINGLVAFEGPNGRGKSTLLENMHPFSMLASRGGAIQHHFSLKDSYRDLTMMFNGDEIRTLIKIDGVSRSKSPEGYIWINGQPKVEGKIRSYNTFIEEIFGSSNLFFSSVFCAQNAKKISDMRTGDLKELFAEFLRLQRYEDWESITKNILSVLNTQLLNTHKIADRLVNVPELLKDKKEEHDKLIISSNERTLEVKTYNDLIEDLETKITEAREKVKKSEQDEILLQERIKEVDALKADIKQKTTESKKASEKMEEDIAPILERIQELQEVLKHKDDIIRSAKYTKKNQEEMMLLDYVVSINKNIIISCDKSITKFEGTKEGLETKIENMDMSLGIGGIKQDIENKKELASLLDKKDPECKSTTCEFIAKAVEAEKDIPVLTQKLKALEEEKKLNIEKIETEIDKINLSLEETILNKNQAEYSKDGCLDMLSYIEFAIDAMAKHASMINMVEHAERELKEKTDLRTKMINDDIDRFNASENKIIEINGNLKAIEADIERLKGSIDTKLKESLTNLEKEIALAREARSAKEKELTAYQTTKSALEESIKNLEKENAEFKKRMEQKTAITTEISDWEYLKFACSKKGLQALEIDSVAPSISGFANDLLNQNFGPAFSLKFITKDDETGREILDIIVIRDDGTEVLLDNLSGGELVWNLKALRLAMLLVSASKSGKDYKTLLCDEEDGALNKENAVNFISMYRSVLQIAHMDTCFYISHKPEAINMADRLIDFSNGINIE